MLAALSAGARAADDDNTTGGELATVTVTARYETEDLQKTPIAISTTSSDQLKSANVSSINTLGQLVPNLYTHPGDADESGVPTIVMRGVSQDDASYARAPAVAMYIDDVYHATAVGSELDLTDVDRKPYAIANAQIDYVPQGARWTATAGVTNLTNKFYYYQLFSGGAVNISSNVAPPREYFFSVRRDF